MSIDLTASTLTAITRSGNEVRLRFEPAQLIKTMTGSDERTLWSQNIELVFEDAELLEGDNLDLPGRCTGGDVSANIYTYRDMVPVPLESRGRAGCVLKVGDQGGVIRVEAEAVRLDPEDRPRYIKHIRD